MIIFEGTDGVGKTTLAKQLTARLKDAGVPCDYVSFPGKESGSPGQLVDELHHNQMGLNATVIAPASLQLLHVAAHIDAIENRILPALKMGRWIVLDRYWWSTWVYGMALGVAERSLKAMLRLEQLHWKRIKPSIVFLVERKENFSAQSEASWRAICDGYRRLWDRCRH